MCRFDIDLAKYGENITLITEEKSYSYETLDTLCSGFEANLPKKKQLILILTKTNIETIVGYLASLRAGYACMMIDSSLDNDLINQLIEVYKPNLIWSEEKSDNNIFNYGSYSLKYHNKESLNLYNDLALLLSTSGTTGSPKMVKLTKSNLYANCNSIVEYLKIDNSHRSITNLPLHYSYGLSILHTHLAKGASLFVTDKSLISKEFWEIMQKHQITTLNGVPYHYEMLKRIGFLKKELPSLKYMTQAGGKLNQTLVKEFASWALERGIKFYVMYGQTEATARISYLPPDMTLKKPKSIGLPIPNGELFIKNLDRDEILKENFIDGELIYKGANVMLGYATEAKELALGDELNGVLHTGDIAYRDVDGYFYITGRMKRFIKIYGNRVNVDEIEQFLKSKSYDVLCTGEDDNLMVITKSRGSLKQIRDEIISKFGIHHLAIKLKEVDEYPTTSSGKIEYKKIKEMFQ